jgi:hypothetical protein
MWEPPGFEVSGELDRGRKLIDVCVVFVKETQIARIVSELRAICGLKPLTE